MNQFDVIQQDKRFLRINPSILTKEIGGGAPVILTPVLQKIILTTQYMTDFPALEDFAYNSALCERIEHHEKIWIRIQ